MLITVEMVSGGQMAIAPAHVTHLVPVNLGTEVHFVSGEYVTTSEKIGELTLDLIKAAS